MVARHRLGEMLVDAGIITEEQLKRALDEQKVTGEQLGKILIRLGFAEEEVISAFLAAQLGIPYVSLKELGMENVDPSVMKLIPDNLVQRQLLIPIAREGNTLTVAMANPLNVLALDDISMVTGCNVRPVIAPESEIKEAIEKYYGTVTIEEAMKEAQTRRVTITEEEELDLGKLIKEGRGAPVINLVNHMIVEAIRLGASDIHIEPYEKSLRARFRVDGVLHEMMSPPKQLQNAIISRIKIMAHLDIAERRLPQDGRCKVRLEDKDVDLRISIVPTTFGEKVGIRILDVSQLCFDLSVLGFEPEVLQLYQEHISIPYGFILVTGPTGSGKTTTLYSTLRAINTPEKHIITIEDPVEYIISGINQTQIKPDIGLTFAAGLRAFLRQDPDVIMVGEIRDRETAEVAVNAALTGHLVFSTLHTNDAPGAVTRLLNMGVEPFLISSTVVMCVAQRLVRIICPKCKEPYEVSKPALRDLGIDVEGEGKVTLYRGVGCDHCAGIGYKGRVAVFEVMVLNDQIRDLVVERERTQRIKEAACKAGMITLREAAAKKVLAGITTVEELLRVTATEKLG